jgi:starvation-inducible DNA-binding protein
VKANVRFDDEARREIGLMLNQLLADEAVLHATLRDYHWNANGPESFELQQLFAEQSEAVAEWIDQIARWARATGANVGGSWSDLTRGARVRAVPGTGLPAVHMLAQMIALLEDMTLQLETDREVCAERFLDFGTVEFLTILGEQHANSIATLRARLDPDRWDTIPDLPLKLQNHE